MGPFKDPERRREYLQQYNEAHRAEACERTQRWYEEHREQKREYDFQYGRDRRAQLRADILRRYGDVCACCGSTERLTIDHVNGDGYAHRQELRAVMGYQITGDKFYRWLLRMYLPPGYQTLCASCNQSKRDGEHCRLDHTPGAPSYADQHRERNNERKRAVRAAAKQVT